MDQYSAITKKEINDTLSNMDEAQDICLSERNQSQKLAYCMIPFVRFHLYDMLGKATLWG